MSTVCGVGKGFAAFFYWNILLESAEWSACVSKQFLRWINRWQRTSHWSDSSPIDFITSKPSPRGLLCDVLVLGMYDIHSAVVKGRSRPKPQVLLLGQMGLQIFLVQFCKSISTVSRRYMQNGNQILQKYEILQNITEFCHWLRWNRDEKTWNIQKHLFYCTQSIYIILPLRVTCFPPPESLNKQTVEAR